MNEAPVATRDAPVERNVLRFIVWMVDINLPLLAQGSAKLSSQFHLTALGYRKPKGGIKSSELSLELRDE
jgi:hypothetical protein